MRRRARRQTIAVMVFVVVALFFAVSFRTAVVKGDSMLPTYHDGQIVLVNRLYRLVSPLRPGDVVLVRKGHEVLIKRVGYVAGDTIDGRSAWSFYRVSEYFDAVPASGASPPLLRVPPGYVVVLGDNKSISDDSRSFGPVAVRDVLGRVVNAPPKP